MPRATSSTNVIATIGIDIGKNTFHVIGLDDKGAIILRHKLSRGQVYARLANIPPCLIGMEACVGAHHLSRQLKAFGHDARLMPARYVQPYSRGQKNDFRDAEAIAEAVLRPTMKFVAIKTVEQLDLQALHRVRERLVCQRTQRDQPDPRFRARARHCGAPGAAGAGQRDAQYSRHDGQAVAPHDPHDRGPLYGLAPSRYSGRDRVERDRDIVRAG